MTLLGGVIGLVAACGGWLVLLRLPMLRRPTLEDRIAPYLGVGLPSQRSRRGLATLMVALGPAARRLGAAAARLGSDPVSVRARLVTAASRSSLEEFRAQQLLAGFAGLALGGLAALGLAAAGRAAPLQAVGLVSVGGLAGVLITDGLLSRRARRRVDAVMAEFPSVAELLALSVGAGEGALGALDRVVRTCTGALADELRVALGETRTGVPVAEALQRLADRIRDPNLAAFVDGVVLALDRGTPLADVLRAQAHDVRVLGRRRLMEAGVRREIAMMVPVVFLILPVTVLFAVYPGLAVLDLDI